MSNENKPMIFDAFLRREGVLEDFKEMLYSFGNDYTDYDDYIYHRRHSADEYVTTAFPWEDDDNLGEEFWSNVDYKWINYLRGER